MLYFSYGTDLSFDAVLDYCRAHQRPAPRRLNLRKAVLSNYRIQFSRHDPFVGSTVADIAAEPGKSVSGMLMEVSDLGLETLRRISGASCSISVKVTPLSGGPPVQATAFSSGETQHWQAMPARDYLDQLIEAAGQSGLSMMWVMHLQTFAPARAAFGQSPLRPELIDEPRGKRFIVRAPRRANVSPRPLLWPRELATAS